MNKTADSRRDFSGGKVWKNITAQAVPLTIANLVHLLYNIVDRIYIGHLPGAGALALTGVGVTFPITTLILAFANLYSTGGTPLFSIARGAREEDKAREIMGNVFTLIIITSVLIFALCEVFKRPILYLFGASGETIVYAEGYLGVYLFGVLFSLIVTGMNGFISALGFARKAMWTTIIGAVFNLVLDPVFIFGFKLGVQGAALATVISQGVSAVWVMHFLLSGRTSINLRTPYMKLKRKTVAGVLGLGISGFMQQATNSVVQIVCNVTLQNWGGDLYVGIMTIINSVREMVSLPVNGISSGGQPVLGYNYGAKKNDRVKEGIRFISAAGIVYTSFMWLLIELVPDAFIKEFSPEAETIPLGPSALKIYFRGYVFKSLQFMGQAEFVGLGKSKKAVFFSLLRKVVIVVPLTIFLPLLFGTDGVFIAEPVSNLIGGLACFLTMYFTVYRKL